MKQYQYTESGLDNIYLANGFVVKDDPEYGECVSIHNVEGLHEAIAIHFIHNSPGLTGAEVRFLRKYLDLSQAHLAHLIGVAETSIRAWENGRSGITAPAERLLRICVLEHTHGDGTIRELIEHIADMNRDAYHGDLRFSEDGEQWRAAA